MSITAVQARIAEIQARLAPPPASNTGAAFNAVLSQAVSQAGAAAGVQAPVSSAAVATPAAGWTPPPRAVAAAPPIPTGKLEPPADLRAYGNGKIPSGALSEIGDGSHRMWAPAATSFKRLITDARASGIDIGVTDSYRSYEQQVDLAERKGLYSQGGLAATPGTSNHGWGLSLDLDLDSEALAWMRANGKQYGFVEDVPREPWHWTYRAG